MTVTLSTILPVIERVRRAMPRNADVMAVCDACLVFARSAGETAKGDGPKRDRAAYMRGYRKRERELIRKARGK